MSSTDLNRTPSLVLWFDDLGSGNEEFRFLSNFFEGAPLTLPGVTWAALARAHNLKAADVVNGERLGLDAVFPDEPVEFLTGEHAFAAMKFWGSDWTWFQDIVACTDPNDAKAAGRSRKHPLREDWEIVKLDVMAAVLRAKFTPEREEGARLLATGDKLLVEGTYWSDDVWGVDLTAEGLPGRNWLGTLLMARRAELRALAAFRDSGDYTEAETRMMEHFATNTGTWNAEFAL